MWLAATDAIEEAILWHGGEAQQSRDDHHHAGEHRQRDERSHRIVPGGEIDVSDEQQIERLFSAAREHYGRVDIGVYSAGNYAAGAIAELTVDQIRPSLEIRIFCGLISR